MSTDSSDSAKRLHGDDEQEDSKIARALQEYAELMASGEDFDLDLFLTHHADLRPELVDVLRTIDAVQDLSEGVEKPHQFGDFRILGEAGRGGMGIVYEAVQMSLDRRVALKILPAGYTADAKSVARFYREAKVSASLHHPNIVEVHAMGVEAGVPYFAMEYVEGHTLQQLLRCLRPEPKGPRGVATSETVGGPGDVADSRAVTAVTEKGAEGVAQMKRPPSLHDMLSHSEERQPDGRWSVGSLDSAYFRWLAEAFAGAADGLQKAHNQGVVHRDLKPSNLILDVDGRLRILDFGLALVEGQTGLTLSRERLGTPLYMSPEQASESSRELGPGTDIYSLGATLYEMMVWRPPLVGRSSVETLDRIVHRDPVPPRKVKAQVPRPLETIVLKCLEKKPDHRYGTAEALAQELRRFARGDPIEARPATWPQRLARRTWRARRRVLEAVGALALVLSLAIVVWGHTASERARRETEHEGKLLSAVKDLIRVELNSPWTRLGRAEPESFELRLLEEGPILESTNQGGTDALFEAGPELVDIWPDRKAETREHARRAVQTLEEAIELNGRSPQAEYLLARAHFASGDEDPARECLSRSLEHVPAFAPALALGRILEEEGEFTLSSEQRSRISSWIQTGGEWRRSWIDAQRAIQDRRWKDAAAAYESLLTVAKPPDPPYPGWDLEVLVWSGLTHFQAGVRERFSGAFSAVHTLWPDAMEPVLLLGKAACLSRSWSYAEDVFRTLFRKTQDSRRDEVACAIASVYREVGNHQRSRMWAQGIRDSRLRRIMLSRLLCLLGSTQDAYGHARDLLGEYPGDIRGRLLQGNALVRQKRFEEAQKHYQLAADEHAFDPRPLINLGICLEAQDQLDEAVNHLRQALKLERNQPQAHYNLARILARRGRTQEAMDSYERAIVADANCSLAYNNLGILLDRSGLVEDARKHYATAARVTPNLGLAHFNLGWAYQRQGRSVDASEAYQEAIRLGLAKEAIVHENLAPALMEQERLPEAIKELRVALGVNPRNARTHNNLAVALHRHGQLDDAIEHYYKAAELEPAWKNVHNALAYAYLIQERYDEAVPEYRRVLELDPDFVHAHNDLAVLMLKSGRAFPRGDELEAEIRRLEDATLLPMANQAIPCLLDKYRQALTPYLATYSSVDAVLDSLEDLVPEGAPWRYLVPDGPPSTGLEWTQESFDHAAWTSGVGGVGSIGAGRETVALDLEGRSIYLRHRFEVGDPGRIQRLLLSVTASGGFVAYLNGVEVGRMRAGEPNTTLRVDAKADWEEYEPYTTRTLWIDSGHLTSGTNILALHGLHYPAGKLEFHLLPSLKARVPFDSSTHQRVLNAYEEFQRTASSPGAGLRLTYFDAGLLQRRGLYAEAAAKYREVLESDKGRPEPFLRLAECLRLVDNFVEAEITLRSGLNLGLVRHTRLWDAWLRVVLVHLDWSSETTLNALSAIDEKPSRHAADIRWLLGELRDGEDIRINCGGNGYHDAQNRFWSRDRFWLGGWRGVLPGLADPRVTLHDRPLYESERYFYEPVQVSTGYAVPLPEGEYRVTLLFVEGWFKVMGSRRFDVLVENERVLTDYEPLKLGYGVPYQLEVRVPVMDGALNIDFGKRIENPKISAFAIERL